MQESNVSILGFRALQAVMDLRATAGRQPQAAIRGIAERIPPADRARGIDAKALVRVTLHQGARLETEADRPLLDALFLAASQPDADLAAFVCATAILLADRLQNGLGRDDLGLLWETYHAVYSRLERHDRAAIVQGFLTGKALGRAQMPAPAPTTAHLTQSEEFLRSELLALANSGVAAIADATASEMDSVAETLAIRHLRALLAGSTAEPLTGDALLFSPLLALASERDRPGYVAATALLLAEALRNQDAEGWFAVTLWPEQIAGWLSLETTAGRTILSGLRYLYESDPEWCPLPDIAASPRQTTSLPLLPVLDAAFSPWHPGNHTG